MAERSVDFTYETSGQWCRTFGPACAVALRRRRHRPGDKWHVDEVHLKVHGRRFWLWRAVDQEGVVDSILVQERRNHEAAEAFFFTSLPVLASSRSISSTTRCSSSTSHAGSVPSSASVTAR